MSDDAKNLFEVVIALANLFGLFAAALWTYFRFFREGNHRPRIEFDLLCTFYESKEGQRGALFQVTASNRGNVEHKFVRISLKVRGINVDQRNTRREDGRWEFPVSILKAELVPEEFGYFFVRPGITQSVTFPTTVPAECRQVWARAAFKYQRSKDLHTVEQVFNVGNPGSLDENLGQPDAAKGGGGARTASGSLTTV